MKLKVYSEYEMEKQVNETRKMMSTVAQNISTNLPNNTMVLCFGFYQVGVIDFSLYLKDTQNNDALKQYV